MKNFARSLYATTSSRVAMGVALAMFGAVPAFAQDAAADAAAAQASTAAQDADAAAQPATTAAQDQTDETANIPEDQDIVVTGIRASLESSARIKRNTSTIIEVVSAEDIGKLPDVSIADSLARLPGVTAQRLEGRDQRLSIRGLGPDFGTTLLNGREQVTVGDNRGVEYDQYPSEFFKNVVVAKSANASIVPAGISGTVDLRMLRPLSERDRIISVQLRGQLNGQDKLNPEADRVGYRASATYVDQFAEDTVGISLGFSHTKSVSQNERYNSWGFPTDASVGNNLLLGGAKPYVQSNELERTGVVGTLEFAPSDRLHATLDVLYSKFKETQYLRGIEFPIAPAWGSGNVVDNYTVEDGLVTDAQFSNVVGVVRNDYNRRKADNFSIGLNTVYGITDTINLTLDGSWSKADRTDFLLENYTGTGYATSGAKDTIQISLNDDGTFDIVPTLDYGNSANLVITDPRGWGYNGTQAVVQAGFLNQPKFEDDLKALRASLDGEINSTFLNRWEVGGVYSKRSKDSKYTSYFLCPKDPNPDCTVASGTATSLPIPDAAIIGTVPLDYLGVPSMIALDPLYLYDNVYDSNFDNRPDSLARDYNVTEKVLTGYAMLNIDAKLGSVPVAGAIGAQIVHTKQDSSGLAANYSTPPIPGGVPTVTIDPVEGGSSYTDFLPSLALSFELGDGLYLKTGASKTMVRPRMDQMRVSQNVSVDFTKLPSTDPANSAFSSRGGNPELEPYRSRNLDLSLEKYFRKGGYIAFTVYHKKLMDFVDPNNSVVADFSELAALLPPEIQDDIGTTQGVLVLPANTGDGKIFGQELSLDLPFKNLTDALDGFGFFGSVSHVKSDVQFANSPDSITVPGLSKWVGTASAYYEKDGFQARLSYRYRSKFLAEIAGLSANPEFRTAKAEGILDAQIGYEFQEGTFKGLSIMAQAKNLTDEPFTTYELGDSRLVRDFQHYGRDFYLSVAYKF
jgi:iron complex outermembrane receptor protein